VKLKQKLKCLQWNSLILGIDYLAVATEVTQTFEKKSRAEKILFGM
jgi:hypothetical protein